MRISDKKPRRVAGEGGGGNTRRLKALYDLGRGLKFSLTGHKLAQLVQRALFEGTDSAGCTLLLMEEGGGGSPLLVFGGACRSDNNAGRLMQSKVLETAGLLVSPPPRLEMARYSNLSSKAKAKKNRKGERPLPVTLPLIYEKELMGVLGLYFPRRRTFTEHDITFQALLADQAAIALKNIQLYRRLEQKRLELKKKAFELSILYRVSNTVSYISDYNLLFRALLNFFHKVMEFNIGSYIILAGEEWHLNIYSPPLPPFLAASLKDNATAAARAMSRRYIGDDNTVLTYCGGSRRKGGQQTLPGEFGFFLNIPLIVNNSTIGLVNLAGFRKKSFAEKELRLLFTIAGHASTAMENLREILCAERSKMETMVHIMADGVIMSDMDNRVMVINPAARKMLQLRRETDLIENKLLLKRLGFDPRSISKQGRGAVFDREIKAGKDTYQAKVSKMAGRKGETLGVVTVIRDVTEQKELERLKDEFVSIISHELRTPLASIIGSLDLLLNELTGGLQGEQREFLTIARENSQRLKSIVNDLLDLSKLEAGKFSINAAPLAVDELLYTAAKAAMPAAEVKGVSLLCGPLPELPRVRGDFERLLQVMQNLLSNAVKFTAPSGVVKTTAYLAGEKRGGTGGRFVKISVQDSGCGIAAKDLSRVFDKFYKVEDSEHLTQGGTGLGLPISRQIIEGHGGKIWVESVPGQGSNFCFTLPLASAG